jgi:hypothetical protein
MSVALGTIDATIASGIDASVTGQHLVLVPTTGGVGADGSITWSWSGSAAMPPAYIPKR